MLIFSRSTAALTLALVASVAQADFATGPDPYSTGFGFDRPSDASAAAWGGWTRGSAGTTWAEWDQFTGGASPRPADVGTAGTPSAVLGWNVGTFAAGSGNLYNFSGVEIFTITVDGSQGPVGGPVTVALQTETWGTPLEFDSLGGTVAPVSLNGAQWETKTVTYQQADFNSAFGPVLLEHLLFTWTLPSAAASYSFVLQGGPHLSFTQAAVDIGPSAVPVPAAVWLFGSALTGVAGIARRRRVASGTA